MSTTDNLLVAVQFSKSAFPVIFRLYLHIYIHSHTHTNTSMCTSTNNERTLSDSLSPPLCPFLFVLSHHQLDLKRAEGIAASRYQSGWCVRVRARDPRKRMQLAQPALDTLPPIPPVRAHTPSTPRSASFQSSRRSSSSFIAPSRG
jgi:hypothetical protein